MIGSDCHVTNETVAEQNSVTKWFQSILGWEYQKTGLAPVEKQSSKLTGNMLTCKPTWQGQAYY